MTSRGMIRSSLASRPSSTLTCGACCKTYDEAAWRALAVSERIEPPEVRRVLSHWPDDLLIEVRRCKGCGRTIAAKRNAQG